MIDLVDKSLGELAESSCVVFDTATGDVDPTPFGKIMSYYYLSHKTIRHLIGHAKREPTFQDVLSWMCSATEFDDLPVRHNEDLINGELSRNLPLPVDSVGPLPLGDPHVKSFLLLQAYMSRIDLPISDYVGDQISVLDQSIRVIQASIDVLAELGYLYACRRMICLLQCIKSARWPDDHPLSILPGIEPVGPKPDETPNSLAALASLPLPSASSLIQKLCPSSTISQQFSKAASVLPHISISLSNLSMNCLTVVLTRQNPHENSEFRIYAPRFPKPQVEGYFLIISAITDSGEDGDLLVLKRMAWPPTIDNGRKGNRPVNARSETGPPVVRTTVTLDDNFSNHNVGAKKRVNVRVVSDAYIGMEWLISGVELPK
jgi:antiviral helicase SLH1